MAGPMCSLRLQVFFTFLTHSQVSRVGVTSPLAL